MHDTTSQHDDGLYWEFYVIRIYRKNRKLVTYLSVENKPVYLLDQAYSFDTPAEAYKWIRKLPKGIGVFEVERIIQYPECGPSEWKCPDLILRVLDEIPMPYAISAISWYEGDDIRSTLQERSASTYYRHRKKLLQYGIDIREQCNVHIIRYKKSNS